MGVGFSRVVSESPAGETSLLERLQSLVGGVPFERGV
jgi:hypothetical protein